MKLIIDISKDRYDEIMAMDWVNGRRFFDEELRAIHDGKALEQEPKVAYWEWNQYDANPKIGNFHCSLCHSIGRTYFDYCPYCGANMSEIPTELESEDKP